MNMTDASSRLARWRLRLLEFDFTVQYKKVVKNTIADCISRLFTYGETAVEPDVSIPCLNVEQDTDTYPFLDVELDDSYDEMLVASVDICDVEEVREISPITNEELIQAQFTDAYCRDLHDSLERGEGSPFAKNDKGILVRISPVDRSEQIVVPKSLRAKVLYLNHQPRFAVHPGGTRIFSTMRRTYYLPAMALDVYVCVRDCVHCAKEKLALRKLASFLKLFPATRPLEQVAIDILGPLGRTTQRNRYLLVISDRFSKLTKAVPLRIISSYTAARAFCDHWVFTYGPPVCLLSDNGKQFSPHSFEKSVID